MGRMGLIRLTAAAVLVPAVTAFVADPGEANNAPQTCSVGRRHLAVADTQAVVVKTRITRYDTQHEPLNSYRAYRGCALGGTRSFVLGHAEGECDSGGCARHISRLTLAGTVVAFERSASSEANPSVGFEGSGEWIVVVRDLRTGRTLHSIPTGTPNPSVKGLVGNGETTALVVKPDGAVAWINNTSQESARYEVHAVDATGSRVLAVSSSIDRSSLALAGSTLYWTENGVASSVRLN